MEKLRREEGVHAREHSLAGGRESADSALVDSSTYKGTFGGAAQLYIEIR
jgi:hypothetical protein